MQEIAIIGLGAMGSRMAARLVEAGHPVVVSSRRRHSAIALEAAGATWAESPREAARRASIVITMVTDDAASRAVWLDEGTGALAGLREGALAIESSTVTPSWMKALAGRVAERRASILAAPVIGSRPQADAGQLIYLAGGEPEVIERADPVLLAMGRTILRTDSVGHAMALKLAVNALFAVQVVAWAEVVGLLAKSGIEPEAAAELLGATPVASPVMRGVAPAMVAQRFDPMFPIDLVDKDLRYFAQIAREVRADVPTATAVHDVYTRARQLGHGSNNITAVAQTVG